MHLDVLAKFFEFVHLDDWIKLARIGKAPKGNCCAITFDDGWRDTYEFGWPVLQAAGVPATCFLVTSRVGSNYWFWPNRLARILFDWSADDNYLELPGPLMEIFREVGVKVTGAFDANAIDQAIFACKSLPDPKLESALNAVTAPTQSMNSKRILLNWSEVGEMAACDLMRYGSHTRRHIRLCEPISEDVLFDEVVTSRKELEKNIIKPVSLFCYPNGDFTKKAIEIVRQNYDAAVSSISGWNTCRTNSYLLRRIGIHEDIASDRIAFLSRIAGFP
ncbi:MAG: polysaccharide deacetylase family protein [Proteobacteria bacterium]|nr:polysaccharide deacetylase family protein [Pseudomonadota bacterium]